MKNSSLLHPSVHSSDYLVEDIRALHGRLRLQTLTQNQKDLDSYKDKINFSINKITEIESNLLEIKNLRLENDKKYEALGTIFLKSAEEFEHKSDH